MKYLILILFISLFAGCDAKYKDISNKKEYSKIVKKTYELQYPAILEKMTLGSTKKDSLDAYHLSFNTLSNTNAPEIIGIQKLVNKSKIKILKVMKCTNCLGDYIEFRIEIVSQKNFKKVPIKLSTHISTQTTKNGKYIIMNSKYFKKIKE